MSQQQAAACVRVLGRGGEDTWLQDAAAVAHPSASDCLSAEQSAVCPTPHRTSSLLPFLGGSFLNSSASASTRFMCLSYAINLHVHVPTQPGWTAQQHSSKQLTTVAAFQGVLGCVGLDRRCRLLLRHACLQPTCHIFAAHPRW